jgi:hypothetical protein
VTGCRPRLVTPLVTGWIVAGASAAAQTPHGSLRGIITNEAGAALPGASVELTRVETGERREASAGREGEFTIAPLAPGDYRLEVRAQGYQPGLRRLTIVVNRAEWIDVSLRVGGLAQVVEVVAPMPMVERDSPALTTVIDARQIARLPLDGRNFLELSLLAPGTAPAAPGSATSVRGDFAFAANGAREDANAYLPDGVYNVGPKLNGVAVRPPVDAIREFEVLTGGYDASFGRNAGAHVNVVTKSGANRFDGTVYGFLRNGALDARNFFAPRTEDAPPVDQKVGAPGSP